MAMLQASVWKTAAVRGVPELAISLRRWSKQVQMASLAALLDVVSGGILALVRAAAERQRRRPKARQRVLAALRMLPHTKGCAPKLLWHCSAWAVAWNGAFGLRRSSEGLLGGV